MLNDRPAELQISHRFAWKVAKERLCDLMIRGAVPFDRPLSERSLAEAIGLGRMPVREALRDLARDGVVVTEAARGTFVRRLSAEEIGELCEVRLAIEGFAARVAAEKGFVGNLPELSASLAKLRRDALDAGEIADAEMLGDHLHWAVMQGAGNHMLMELYSGIRLRIRISLRLLQRREFDRIRETIDEHLAVAEAILARDPAGALARMQDHLRRGYEATLANYGKVLPAGRGDEQVPEREVGMRRIRRPQSRLLTP